MTRRLALLFTVLAASCSSTQEGVVVPDATPVPDSPLPIDARLPDAPVPDARPDATVDAAPPDGRPDANSPDGCVPVAEKCNFMDDDCDGMEDETFTDLGDPCVAGVGICAKSGLKMCTLDGLGTKCSATPATPGTELCANGLDDDCDGTADEGFEMLGTSCSVGVGACKATGAWICSTDKKSLVCSATPGVPAAHELCGNNVDDNCNGATDEGFELFGTTCMNGVGICARPGFWVCSGDKITLQCNAVPVPPSSPELCGNKLDDNCNGFTDEGFTDLGDACDGDTDLDKCLEGVKVCSNDKLSTVCNDNTGNNPELCDGVDNDCNPATPDGMDEPLIKVITQCDGTLDQDQCIEGIYTCSGAHVVCNDPGDDELSNDVLNCGGCANPCEELHASQTCSGSTCIPSCTFPYQSCDNNGRNGCEETRDNSATCFAPTDLGEWNGDDDTTGVTKMGFFEAAYKIRMLEDDWTTDDNANGVVVLTNPSDATFKACAYCASCQRTTPFYSGGVAPFKCITPPRGGTSSMILGKADDDSSDNDVDLYIEVTYVSGSSNNASCGNWSLNIHAIDNSSDCTCEEDKSSVQDGCD